MDAIIGSTGFVGTNLLAAHEFAGRFHSKNIDDIDGARFNLVICAAAPATMWAANKDPEGDLRNISGLITHLERMAAERVVLVSTIAVLAKSEGLVESSDRFETVKAYGRNRRVLEEACVSLFERCHIVRLPALFGCGLKKNFLFDIANPVPSALTPARYGELEAWMPETVRMTLRRVYRFDSAMDMYLCDRAILAGVADVALTQALREAGATALGFTHADSMFQYYGLKRLWADIGLVIANELPVMHLVPSPLSVGEIYRVLTGEVFEQRSATIYREDTHTLYARLWGEGSSYIQSRDSVLSDLVAFHRERSAL